MGIAAPLAALATSFSAALPSAAALSTIGTAVSVAGSLFSGFQANSAAKAEAKQIELQRQTEAELAVVEDSRLRAEFARRIAEQRLDIAGRGASLDSPAAIVLGRSAAREMSFASQSRRSSGQATDRELSFAARSARARGANALISGVSTAGSALLRGGADFRLRQPMTPPPIGRGPS